MNKQTFRLIFKQLQQLKHQEPTIANHVSGAIRQHVEIYRTETKRMEKKIKKQKDNQLPQAFLNFLTMVNSSHTFDSHRVKLKLIEIYMDLDHQVNAFGHLRRERESIQIQTLKKYPPFLALKKQSEKEWVEKVVKKLFLGNERYEYSNLTAFFKFLKPQKSVDPSESLLQKISPQKQDHVKKILKGDNSNVSKQFLLAYRQLFEPQKKQRIDMVLECYIRGRYILLDFENVKCK